MPGVLVGVRGNMSRAAAFLETPTRSAGLVGGRRRASICRQRPHPPSAGMGMHPSSEGSVPCHIASRRSGIASSDVSHRSAAPRVGPSDAARHGAEKRIEGAQGPLRSHPSGHCSDAVCAKMSTTAAIGESRRTDSCIPGRGIARSDNTGFGECQFERCSAELEPFHSGIRWLSVMTDLPGQ